MTTEKKIALLTKALKYAILRLEQIQYQISSKEVIADLKQALALVTKCDGSIECGDESCQACCPHDEFDHGICLDCGKDCYEDLAAAAYDRAKDFRKYGK